MDWHNLLSALCLVLVIEGLLPFINPKAWKEAIARFLLFNDKTIRSVALMCMLAGLLGLMLIRA